MDTFAYMIIEIQNSGVQFPRSTGHISVNVTALKPETKTIKSENVPQPKPKENVHNVMPQCVPDSRYLKAFDGFFGI